MNAIIKRILLVDDDEIANYITERLIKEAGIAEEIKVLHNGQEALDYLNDDKNPEPDVILLDLNMEVLDAFGFLQSLQESKRKSTPKIIILSTSVREKDIERTLVYSEVIGYLSKPLETEELIALIS